MRSDRSDDGVGGAKPSHVAKLLATLPAAVQAAFARAEALVVDVDGVLTDGRIHCDAQGVQSMSFHVRDSSGVWQAHKAGLRIGMITGRGTGIPEAEKKIFPFAAVRVDSREKAGALRSILDEWKLDASRIAYIGDDLLDGPALRIAGLPIVVGDCEPDLVPLALYVTRRHGGYGAVREVTDLLLEARGARTAILAALEITPPEAPQP